MILNPELWLARISAITYDNPMSNYSYITNCTIFRVLCDTYTW